jgi:hypothetical protein
MSDRDPLQPMVRDVLRAQAAPGPCAGADVLAARYDNALSKAERIEVDRHIAACPRCQAQLALMARADTGRSERPATHSWIWTVRVAGLAAVAVLAVAVWALVGRTPAAPEMERAATAPQSTLADRELQREARPPASLEAPPSTPAPKTERPAPPVRPRQAEPVGAAAGKAVAVDQVQLGQSKPAGERRADAAGRGTVAGRPTEPTAVTAASPVVQTSRGIQTASQAQAQQRVSRAEEAVARDALAFSAVLSIATADGRHLWRPGGKWIERSADGGRVWVRDEVADAANIVAGAAPSASVCWMVGREGLVLRYEEGPGWTRVISPASVDLVQITARDAGHAIVTAADGRRFETSDGGRTWRPVER